MRTANWPKSRNCDSFRPWPFSVTRQTGRLEASIFSTTGGWGCDVPNQLVQIFQYHSVRRTIWTDGRALPKDPDNLSYGWYGYSVGKWDGDTFVVETIGFNGKGWLDTNGHPTSDALHVTERFKRKDVGHMDIQITIDDPKVYTKPWTTRFTLVKQPGMSLRENVCMDNHRM